MKVYMNKWAAIIGLHERGFTEDFELSGSEILWVQQRVLLPLAEITLIEFHRFTDSSDCEMVIFGVIASQYCVQGILIAHQNKRAGKNESAFYQEPIPTKQIQAAYEYDGSLCHSL